MEAMFACRFVAHGVLARRSAWELRCVLIAHFPKKPLRQPDRQAQATGSFHGGGTASFVICRVLCL